MHMIVCKTFDAEASDDKRKFYNPFVKAMGSINGSSTLTNLDANSSTQNSTSQTTNLLAVEFNPDGNTLIHKGLVYYVNHDLSFKQKIWLEKVHKWYDGSFVRLNGTSYIASESKMGYPEVIVIYAPESENNDKNNSHMLVIM